MKNKLIALVLLLLPCLIGAESKVFELNGKPVPAVVAKINGKSLSSARLESEFIIFRLRAQSQGKTISPTEEPLFAREVLKAEIMKELIAQKSRSLNIKITPEKIDQEIQNIENKFPSQTAFITALAFQRLNLEALMIKIENTLLEDELIRQEIAPKVKLGEDASKNYYKANRKVFSKPALYRTRHILFSTIKVPENIKDETNQKKALRIAQMINNEAKLNAEEVLQKINQGGNFDKLAKELSEDEVSKKKGGLLGDLHPDSTIPEIAAEMVKLKEGDTSSIIQSAFGYHIIKLDEIIPSTLIPFEKAESDILNILMKRETQKLFKEYLIDLEKTAKIEIFI
jgi:parvulin-like peptidyl-prolyl isomerase